MNKKLLSIISTMAAVTAILPGMNLGAFNTAPSLTANAEWSADGTMFYNGNGYYTGWHLIDGENYFFDSNGNKVTSSFIDWNNNTYYVDENGHSIKNDWAFNEAFNSYCYFNSLGRMVKNDWIYDPNYNSYYYLGSDGKMVTNDWIYDPTHDSYYYLGLDGKEEFGPELFDSSTGISTTIGYKTITQTKKIGDTNFKLVIDLRFWAHGAEPYQIKNIADLYWGCYPKMYNRFVKDVSASEDVMYIHIKPCGGTAGTGGHDIDINDDWAKGTKDDYDAVTHELGHTLQNRYIEGKGWDGWDGTKCEHSDFIENFADYCRYVYAYNDGYYNDKSWNPEKIKANGESTHNSIRFLIWLDYKYSTTEYDPIVAFSDVCRNENFNSDEWDKAWTEIFSGSDSLKNRTISNVWNEYINDKYFSDAKATTDGYGIKSELMQRYPDLRSKLAR